MEFQDTEEGMPPMEDSVHAFVLSLVGPILNQYQRYEETSDATQQQLAKQMLAIVLLYNYYHRKNYPLLEFLNGTSFCKFAVVSCRKLTAYMGVMKGFNQSSLQHPLTPTERLVKEACETCKALESPKAMSDMKAWPISKVSVFVVDAMKEKCILIYGSITKGVWSLIEKDVDGFDGSTRGTSESDKKTGQNQKEKGSSKRAVGSVLNAGDFEGGTKDKFLQLAFSAVKEQTGIDQHKLEVFMNISVYSLTKTKTNCRLYIMHCIKETSLEFVTDTEAKWVPVNEALNSVQGPLIESTSPGNYGAAPTVSYFHLRPYYDAIYDWWSRKDSAQTLENVQCAGPICRSSDNQDNLTAPKVSAMRDELGNMKAAFQEDPADSSREGRNESWSFVPGRNPARDTKSILKSTGTEKTLTPLKDKASAAENPTMATKERGDKRKTMKQSLGNPTIAVQNNSISTEQVSSPSKDQGLNRKGLQSLEGRPQAKLVEEVSNSIGMKSRGQETHIPPYTVSDGGKRQSYKSNGVHVVSFEQTDVTHQVEHAISEVIDLSKASFEEISKKRDGHFKDLMTCQSHYHSRSKELHSKIAECDAYMNIRHCGGKEDMALENVIYHKTSSTSKAKRSLEIDVRINDTKRRKLFEGLASLRSSIQELNEICIKNQWSACYRVFKSIDVKELFNATVIIRGVDFELEESGQPRSRDVEAKESAASYMLSTLYRMSGQNE